MNDPSIDPRLSSEADRGDCAGVVFQFAPVGLWITGIDGRIHDVNPAACEMVGYEREALRGLRIQQFMADEDAAERERLLARQEPGAYFIARRRMRRRDSSEIIVEGKAHKLPDGRLVTAVRDITDQLRTEEALAASEREFRVMFELSASGKGQAEVHTRRFVRVNRKLCEITGYSEEDLLARTAAEITHPDDREADALAYAAMLEDGGTWTREKRFVRPDGTIVWVLVTGTILRDAHGKPLRAIATVHDISERKRMEEALREADRRKDEFLATLSHELRNPLAPIRTGLHVLERAEPGSAEAQRMRDILARQVEHVALLVDDLLDVTRVARGKLLLRPEAVDLRSLVVNTIEDHRALFADGGVRLETRLHPEPLPAQADPTRIAQLVGNLLQNAVKFTGRGGRVTLSLTREDGVALLRVADNGPGIAPDVLPRLFSPFTQARQHLDRSRGGLGLGLALVKGVAELHGGSVCARNVAGEGAELEVRLPIEARPRPAMRPTTAPDRTAPRRRVLVIEDNEDTAEALQIALELEGHEVAVTHEGQDAVTKAAEKKPDLVICDLGLPGLDGFEVARALRSQPETARAYMVALSGYALPDDRRRARDAGFDEHLAKPVDLKALLKLLARIPTARETTT